MQRRGLRAHPAHPLLQQWKIGTQLRTSLQQPDGSLPGFMTGGARPQLLLSHAMQRYNYRPDWLPLPAAGLRRYLPAWAVLNYNCPHPTTAVHDAVLRKSESGVDPRQGRVSFAGMVRG